MGTLQPTTLVAYRVDVGSVFDASDAAGLAAHSMSAAELEDSTWRERVLKGEAVPRQEFAERLIGEGNVSLMVRRFGGLNGLPAPGAERFGMSDEVAMSACRQGTMRSAER